MATDTPIDQGREGTEQLGDIQQFVTFVVGEEVFAVDMAPVQEIIRVPEVVRVPLAPSSLKGLANLRGKVLPIVSLRQIFGLQEREEDDTTRALVIDTGQPLGFVVDRVASVVNVETAKIEAVGSISSTVDTDLLSGLIKDVGDHGMIMILEFSRLVGREFSEIAKTAAGVSSAASSMAFGEAESEEEDTGDELQLVSFEVAGQEYAIPIEDVQEIVQVPDQIVHVPRSAHHVLGVMSLRNRLLPLVQLRQMFSLAARDADEHSRIVVISIGASAVGMVVDSVNEVLRVAKIDVEPMPGLLAAGGDLADISDICRLDGGERLVSIISTGHLFRHSAIEEALTTVDDMTKDQHDDADEAREQDSSEDDDAQVVVFRLDKEEFGVPIESVQEIVRVPEELTHVPKAPPFVEGVINLRGTVLPVIDLRRRLDLAGVERSDRQRVMVFLINGARTGFIVDSVAEVLRIPRAAVEPAPQLSSDQSKLLAQMANLEEQQRMIQLIDPTQLVQGQELQDLKQLSSATPAQKPQAASETPPAH